MERSVGQTYDFYYKAFDTWPILHKAVAGECYKVIEQMISQGASLNQAHGSAGTPLFVAVLLGHTRMIEFLITNGAREGTNETLIASATGMGRSDLAELLRKLLPAQ